MTAPTSHSAKTPRHAPAPEPGEAQRGDHVGDPHGPPRQGARLLDEPRRCGDHHRAAGETR